MLGIILLCYKNEIEVSEFIKTELAKIKTVHKVIIIDNSCSLEVFEKLIQLTDAINVTENNTIDIDSKIFAYNPMQNLGYAKGNNIGADFLIQNFNSVNYLLFSNTDIEIISNTVIEVLIQKINYYSDAGIVGPKIIDDSGMNQNPNNYQSFNYRWIITPIFYPIMKYLSKYFPEVINEAKEGHYYRLNGCFLLIKTLDFINIGMFDENTFLYSEEQIISEKLEKLKLKCYYTPNVYIKHFHSQTISKEFSNLKKLQLRYESELYYFKTYRRLTKVQEILGNFSNSFFVHFHHNISNLKRKILTFSKYKKKQNVRDQYRF